jgi:hypothetical protein
MKAHPVRLHHRKLRRPPSGILETHKTAFALTPTMRARLAGMHQREADGSLTPLANFELPQDPEVHMGGHGLGLANLFYWIDRKNGLGGYWATQILPFGDPVSFTGDMDFETAAYQSVVPKKAA